MTRLERKKLTKKYVRNTYLSLVFIGLFALNFILLLTGIIPPLKNPHTWNVVPLVMLSISPIFIALFILMDNQSNGYKLNQFRKELYSKRDKIRIGLIWNAVKSHDIKAARAMLIDENYITYKDNKNLCNGILLGAAQILGKYDDWVNAPNVIMEDIINPTLG